jgi:hypothetical protein
VRDYYQVQEDGRRIPVAELSTSELEDALRCGIYVVDEAEGTEDVDNVLERIKIELHIRRLGL